MNTHYINNFMIIEKIGEGGMSEVYLAEHKYLHKYNALKKLKLQDKTIIDKFIKEAQILYNLNHKFIVKVEDCFDFEDSLYIVMEYVEGEPLNEYISKRERITEDKAIEIFKKILYGVDYAHSLNIIHRDLKPSNIIIDKNENPKILDFGIAKIVKAGIGSGTTSTAMFLGSPAYMSPEQYKNEKVDLRTDIYSLGMVLYEMVTGINPYQTEKISLPALSYKIVHEPLPDPQKYLPNINDNCRKLILKCTEKKPDNRFNTCKEIIDYIDTIKVKTIKIEAEKIKEEVKTKWYKKNKITLTILLIIVIIGLGITSKYFFFSKNENETSTINIKNDTLNNEKQIMHSETRDLLIALIKKGRSDPSFGKKHRVDVDKFQAEKNKNIVTNALISEGYDKNLINNFGDNIFKNDDSTSNLINLIRQHRINNKMLTEGTRKIISLSDLKRGSEIEKRNQDYENSQKPKKSIWADNPIILKYKQDKKLKELDNEEADEKTEAALKFAQDVGLGMWNRIQTYGEEANE